MHGNMERLARVFAVLGGLVLTALILLICLSVSGRELNEILHNDWVVAVAPQLSSTLLATGVGPINGDFEMVEAGIAFVIFAFIPLCHLHGSHASVDIFTAPMPVRVKRILRAVIEVVFAIVIVIITWQLYQGMLSKWNSGQTTLLLQFPVWWGYGVSLIAAVATTIIAIYVAVMHMLEAITGNRVLPAETEADH